MATKKRKATRRLKASIWVPGRWRLVAEVIGEGCGSSPAGSNLKEIDHLILLSRGFGAGSGSGIFPSS